MYMYAITKVRHRAVSTKSLGSGFRYSIRCLIMYECAKRVHYGPYIND